MRQKGKSFFVFIVFFKMREAGFFGGFIEGDEEVFAGEAVVAGLGDDGKFDVRHAVEVTQKIHAVNAHGVEALVGEFAGEAPITVVDGVRDLPQVLGSVVSGAAIDVIDSQARLDGSDPCEIDGMRGINAYMISPGVTKKQILLFGTISAGS